MLLLALAAAVLATVSTWRYARDRSGLDFYQQPWAVPHVLRLVPEEDIWDRATRQRMAKRLLAEVGGGAKSKTPKGLERQQRAAVLSHPPKRAELPVAGTPFFFAALAPFSRGDFTADGKVYLAVLLLAFAASVVALGYSSGLGVAGGLFAYSLLATGFEPLQAELRTWNVGSFLLACVTGAVWLLSRDRLRAAGALLAAGAAFKPTLAPLLVILAVGWLVQRRFSAVLRLLTGAVAGGLVAAIVGCLWVGRLDAWLLFARSLSQLTDEGYALGKGNFGLSRWLLEVTGEGRGVLLTLSGLLVIATALVVATLRSRRGRTTAAEEPLAGRARRDGALLCLGLLLTLLASPLAWLHYFVILVAPALLLMAPPADGEAPLVAIGRQTVAVLSLAVLCKWPTPLPVPVEPGFTKPFLTTAATVGLYLALLLVLARPYRPSSLAGEPERAEDQVV